MSRYTPEKLVAVSRYRNYFPPLPWGRAGQAKARGIWSTKLTAKEITHEYNRY